MVVVSRFSVGLECFKATNVFKEVDAACHQLLIYKLFWHVCGQVVHHRVLGEGLSSGAQRAVALWLGTCAAWVFSMVVLGGVTRLTRSGLSMTEWKFTGERPPRSQADWEAEFAKYKASPEYRHMNRYAANTICGVMCLYAGISVSVCE